ncbi:MAG: hypothetical protein FJ145_13170 [Deltaproteobacteria bacterium]|nr:hypothetical protein [Deltaproteobacteria bacterium]
MSQDFAALLERDALASDLYRDTAKRSYYFEPEKMLLLAVLQDALHCFRRFSAARDRAGLKKFHEARNWIMAPGDEWVFSFASICDTLGLDAQYVRRGLLAWQARQTLRRKTTKGGGLRRRAA